MKGTVEIAYIGLGANIGDRERLLQAAVDALDRSDGITVLRVSALYETAPVGEVDQPPFLNAAVKLATTLEPHPLLERMQAIERALGRVRVRRWGPRTIDLDLLLYGDRIIEGPDLIVPHPRMAERAFVLAPLSEIEPGLRHPALGATVAELLERNGRGQQVTRIGRITN